MEWVYRIESLVKFFCCSPETVQLPCKMSQSGDLVQLTEDDARIKTFNKEVKLFLCWAYTLLWNGWLVFYFLPFIFTLQYFFRNLVMLKANTQLMGLPATPDKAMNEWTEHMNSFMKVWSITLRFSARRRERKTWLLLLWIVLSCRTLVRNSLMDWMGVSSGIISIAYHYKA